MQAGSYATGVVGKWHVAGGIPGLQKYSPEAETANPAVARILAANQELLRGFARARGFDFAASMYSGNLADYRLKALNTHNMEWIVQAAFDFIDLYRERPFFLYFSTTVPHSPDPRLSLTADPRITPAGLPKDVPDVMPPRSSVVPRVKAAGVPEEMAAFTWLDAHQPCMLRWKGRLPAGGKSDALVQNIDFVPAVLDI